MNAIICALKYAKAGLSVLAVWPLHGKHCACPKGANCPTPGKHPIEKAWQKTATTNPARIRAMLAKHPQAHVGVMPPEGCVVLDVDPRNGGTATLRALLNGHKLPKTVVQKSGGGGWHVLFKGEPAGTLGKGIDIKRPGRGFVVAYPARHISGGAYTWRNAPWEVEIASLPARLRGTRTDVDDLIGDKSALANSAVPAIAIETIRHALAHINADEYQRWINIGQALKHAYGDDGKEVWLEWSKTSDRYKEIDYAKWETFDHNRDRPLITIRSIMSIARRSGYRPLPTEFSVAAAPGSDDTNHYLLARAVIDALTRETGEQPVYADGALWTVDKKSLWVPRDLDSLAIHVVGKRFNGRKFCKRNSDFNAVASVAAKLCEDAKFFESAKVGVTAPNGFWHVTDEGEIRQEPLTAAHRQRMRVAADPDPKAKPKRLLRMLQEAFAGHEPEAQTQLLQQLCGCAITCSLWRYRIVGLLLGLTSSGKSTVISVLRSVFPPEQVAATTPAKWGNEYYAAALAGKVLNVVGELEAKDTIPGGAFKSITGRDIVEGRHPTHRPFSFVCEAAHFFNANKTPPTNDHSDAFFRRWRIVFFANSVSKEDEVIDLDNEIIKHELGAFLWWALSGAAEVVRNSGIIETKTHYEKLAAWRVGNNSALAFVLDAKECVRDKAASTSGQAVFDRYRSWAADNGYRPFGRTGFYEAIDAGSGGMGITVRERKHQTIIVGLRLIR